MEGIRSVVYSIALNTETRSNGMKFKTLLMSLFIASAAHADPYTYEPLSPLPTYTPPPTSTYDYDAQSGNSYSTYEQLDGSTRVNGSNIQNGTMWNSTIDTKGNMRGIDSDGNAWSYDRKTGNYINTNGKICTGTGATRVCSDD